MQSLFGTSSRYEYSSSDSLATSATTRTVLYFAQARGGYEYVSSDCRSLMGSILYTIATNFIFTLWKQ
eukprot:scaffold594573_cov19-Prasinocladus_malaysianus.AAC.1